MACLDEAQVELVTFGYLCDLGNEYVHGATIVPDPSLPLAMSVQYRFAAHHQRINLAVHQQRRLACLRDTLLPKLVSGELQVPEAEVAIEEVGA
jgi:type I restriction enzyme S subunit